MIDVYMLLLVTISLNAFSVQAGIRSDVQVSGATIPPGWVRATGKGETQTFNPIRNMYKCLATFCSPHEMSLVSSLGN